MSNVPARHEPAHGRRHLCYATFLHLTVTRHSLTNCTRQSLAQVLLRARLHASAAAAAAALSFAAFFFLSPFDCPLPSGASSPDDET